MLGHSNKYEWSIFALYQPWQSNLILNAKNLENNRFYFSPEETELDVLESEVKNHIQQFINKIETLTL